MSKPTRGIGDKWLDVCRLLNSRGVEYLVVGGVAMALHGRMRATKDIDVLVPRDVENMRRLLEALEALPMGLAGELIGPGRGSRSRCGSCSPASSGAIRSAG